MCLVWFCIFNKEQVRVHIPFSGMNPMDIMGCFWIAEVKRGGERHYERCRHNPKLSGEGTMRVPILLTSKVAAAQAEQTCTAKGIVRPLKIERHSLNIRIFVLHMSGLITSIMWMIRSEQWLRSLAAALILFFYWVNEIDFQPISPPSSFKSRANILCN